MAPSDDRAFAQPTATIQTVGIEVMAKNKWIAPDLTGVHSRSRFESWVKQVEQEIENRNLMLNPKKQIIESWPDGRFKEDGTLKKPKRTKVEVDAWRVPAGSSRFSYDSVGRHYSISSALSTLLSERPGLDPFNEKTIPKHLHPTIDMNGRPTKMNVREFIPPDFGDTSRLPWYERALVPVAVLWAWLLSLEMKWRIAAIVGILIAINFAWGLIGSIFAG